GILGRNGAGKSTLLQIIAGTLRPSTGHVEVFGRIAALLELGSGFNVEYTGRENVYLNAALLGFSKTEVDAKFDDIAAFADIGQFLEQPVKTYSSGMMVRLAFAVQMAIDPTLFIVDEALAVGDIYFQNKCHKLLKQKLDDGLTLLLVSHDPGSVRTLCSRALVLDQGRAAFIGPSDEATSVYHAINSGARAGKSLAGRVAMQVGTDPARDGEEEGTGPEQGAGTVPDGIEQFQDEIGDGSLTLTGCALFDADGHPTKSFTVGDPVRVGVAFVPAQNFPAGQLIAGFQVRDRFNNVVAAGTSLNRGTESAALRAGHRYVQWLELGGRLGPGKYLLDFGVGSDPDHADSARHYHHRIGGIAAFQIEWFGRKVTFQGFCDLDARFSPIH
ncbi:MAG: ABC transporter ATP-binding protein, partial [Gluconacetobacter diazotrophicus]|nr:ABC transporter ATP-binding protein [Gluconacetobacter diazotrophicus]